MLQHDAVKKFHAKSFAETPLVVRRVPKENVPPGTTVKKLPPPRIRIYIVRSLLAPHRTRGNSPAASSILTSEFFSAMPDRPKYNHHNWK